MDDSSIPRSYTAAAACRALGLDKASFHRSGLSKAITRYGTGSISLYDAGEVEAWVLRLLRRRAFVEMGALSPKAPLLAAPQVDEFDFAHEECGHSAFFEPPQSDEEWDGWLAFLAGERRSWPAWCAKCGALT